MLRPQDQTGGQKVAYLVNSLLDPKAEVLSNEERVQLAQLISEVHVIKDQMSKVAEILSQLSQTTAALREQAIKSEAQFSQMRPCLDAMKIHAESFPHALREARRSDVATQKTIEEFAARLQEIERRSGASMRKTHIHSDV